MTKQKGKVLTFFFSLIPGAGEMYMGFMKQGISIMAVFWGIIFLASYFYITPVLFILPIIWFYSFFDVHNLKRMPEEEFCAIEDDYLFHLDRIVPRDKWSRKQNTILAVILILAGGIILWKNLLSVVEEIAPNWFYWRIVDDVPQIVIAAVLIVIGIMMIRGKKAALDEEEEKGEEAV